MAIYELTASRDQVRGNRGSITYMITDTTSDTIAHNTLVANAPAMAFGTLILAKNPYSIKPTNTDNWWEGTAEYVDPDKEEEDDPEVGEVVVSFDASGETIHITSGLETPTRYIDTGSEFDAKGAIGVNNDTVDGVDILSPALKITMTVTRPAADLTDEYVRTIAKLTGKTNADDFKGYEKGELLFAGASGTQRTGENANSSVSYNFIYSENATDIEVGPITVAEKGGHQYLWVRYTPASDAGSSSLTLQPQTVFVETVYESGDFSELGIGS